MNQADPASLDNFLKDADAHVTFSHEDSSDSRTFELVNKTNQFNLNGRRWDPAEWRRLLDAPDSFLIAVSYRDKYGSLGKIAAIAGVRNGARANVAAWVMSCRAFSRRIEHQILRYLFDKFEVDEIAFDYVSTARNGPLTDSLASLLGAPPEPPVSLRRARFDVAAPALFHDVIEGGTGFQPVRLQSTRTR